MRCFAATVGLWLWAWASLPAPVGAQPGGGVADELATEINKALERARPVLLDHLHRQRRGVRALLCLAAAHDGVPSDDKVFARALEHLAGYRFTGTYECALRLMVMAELPHVAHWRGLPERDTERLLANRVRGGFSYARRNGYWDLSNTQYGALGLRAAVALGMSIDREVWLEMAESIAAAQAEDGGFGYTVRNTRRKPYASMTVAGIAILEICRQQLGDAAPDGLGAAIARAWRWMETHRFEIGDTDTPSCYYFHYGLERAAILSDVTKVGERDWYRVGARMLLDHQLDSGAWRSFMEIRPGALGGEGSPVDTGFAILFLRRKFKKALPVVHTLGRAPATLGSLDANASDAQVRVAAEHAVRVGLGAMPQVIEAMRSDVLPRRKAAAMVLPRLTGKLFGYYPYRTPERSEESVRAVELWWLREGRPRLGWAADKKGR